jgi:hypothetical protein
VIGFICNLLIRPVAEKYVMTPEQIKALDAASHEGAAPLSAAGAAAGAPSPTWVVVAAWLAVGIPIAWGVWQTLRQAAKLFGMG